MAVRYNTSIPNNGLIFLVDAANVKSYPGSGASWKDLSGNGNDMTLVNAPVFDGGDKSIYFNGVDEYATTDASNINSVLDTSSYTASCWARPNVFDGERYFFSHGESYDTDKIKWGMAVNSNTFRCWFEAQDDADYYISSSGIQTLQVNTWNHFAITYDGGNNTWKMYINSVLIDSVVTAQQPSSIDHPIVIGCRTNSGNTRQNFFNGNISVAHYYNRVLSDSEISQIFYAYRSRYGV